MIHQREIILIVGLEKNFIRILIVQTILFVLGVPEISRHDFMRHLPLEESPFLLIQTVCYLLMM